MNKYLSDKLKSISFVLMVMVVFLHSYNVGIKYNTEIVQTDQDINWFLQNAISKGFTIIAVPLFFIISGYLLFLNLTNGKLKTFLPKFKKRLKTLVVPYLFWSLYGLAFIFILQTIPISRPYFNNELIVEYSLLKLLNAIFINPVPYQLWFVRDLIILILLSPILYRLIKVFKTISLVLFLCTWLFEFNFVIFSNEALFFFTVGLYIAINKISLYQPILKKNYALLILFWITIVLVKTTLILYKVENECIIIGLNKLSILIGVLSLWGCYDYKFENTDISRSKIFPIFQYSFFLYAFHEPLLSIFRKGFQNLLGASEISSISAYILAPIITILISITLAYFIKKNAHKLYSIITGGR
ncbi:acyltransferase family protein [Maribacter stanieri]|uniref:Acyltransferase family protein n=1 Tax=Maribacter stanieri TaxID=440514 RepID=A0A1I6I618_9FLAO|nr:acyltransferase [Maribacter stanieri]SFR62196.1 Acyltransferase family protein [Maribacter stanieri]